MQFAKRPFMGPGVVAFTGTVRDHLRDCRRDLLWRSGFAFLTSPYFPRFERAFQKRS